MFGFDVTVEGVQELLFGLGRRGVVMHEGEVWKVIPSNTPVGALSSLLGRLPSKVEEATKCAGSVLELLCCKILADADTEIVPGSADS